MTRNAMLGYIRTISVSSTTLLLAVKTVLADPNDPNKINQLPVASKSVTDAIQSLLDLSSMSSPARTTISD